MVRLERLTYNMCIKVTTTEHNQIVAKAKAKHMKINEFIMWCLSKEGIVFRERVRE